MVFRISQDFFGPASLIFGYDPLVAAVVPISVCWIGGLWLCGGERSGGGPEGAPSHPFWVGKPSEFAIGNRASKGGVA